MGYRWRRFYNGAILRRLTCGRPRCGEQRVGLSIYCRKHTDEILSPETLAMLRKRAATERGSDARDET